MSDKPTEVPDWTPAPGDITTPTAGEKVTAHQPKEVPPAQFFNWFWNRAYLWLQWISDGILQRGSFSDGSPVMATSDRSGRIRNFTGPAGYTWGPAVQQQFRYSPVGLSTSTSGTSVSPAGLIAVDVDATFTVNVSNIPTFSFSPCVEIVGAASASVGEGAIIAMEYDGGSYANKQPMRGMDDNTLMVEARGVMLGIDDIELFFGLHDLATGSPASMESTTNRFAMFYLADNGIDILCKTTNGSSITTVDSTINVTAGVPNTYRVELHGANTPVGVDEGNAIARFYIDGVLRATLSTEVPDGNAKGMSPIIAAARISTSTGITWRWGNIRIAWSEVLDADIPV